jgi:CHAT domain-containing protein
MHKRLLIITLLIQISTTLSAQCPDRAFLFHRIVWLRDSSSVSATDQLKELNMYLGKINGCSYQNDSTHAMLIARIGVLNALQKDFTNAIDFTMRAIDIVHLHLSSRNISESHLIKYYNNLSILFDSTAQEKPMREAMDSCIAVCLRLQIAPDYSVHLLDMKVKYLFEKGDYYDCMNTASLAENICRKTGYNREYIPYYIIYKINSLILLRQYEMADLLADKAIHENLASGNEMYTGSLYNVKSDIAASTGNTTEAIRYMKLSLFYNKKTGYSSGYATSWNNLGYKLYFLKLHKNDQALAACKEALKWVDNDEAIDILKNIANIYVAKGDFERAFDFFRQAFNRIRPRTDENNLLNSAGDELPVQVNTEYVISLLLDKAKAYLVRFKQSQDDQDLKHALFIYKTADRFMDKMKASQTELSSKLFWRMATRRLYEEAIESCYLSANTGEAFYFFEKSRAVLLNDQLRQQKLGDKDIREMAMRRKNILRLEKSIAGLNPSSAQYAELQRNLFISKQQLNRADQLVRMRNPWYYQALLDTSFVGLTTVQKELMIPENTETILEFFQGDSAVYLLTIHPKQSRITRINKVAFQYTVNLFSTYLSQPDLENRDYRGFIQCSQDLYRLIFSTGTIPAGRIIISPDGNYFPFEALVSSQSLSAPVYFLTDHVVNYTYSIRYLLNEFPKDSIPSAGYFLGLAPVHYPASLQMSSLNQSDASLQKISSFFPNSHILVESQASRNNFMKLFYGYNVIQLYTHATDSSSNGEPAIYFSDSVLYLSELIPETKPATRLIVLSACETGNGKVYSGEGVFSFNREFAALGIPGSVINLWTVEDESTYKITEFLYKYISQGLPADIALQKAKLEFIINSPKAKRLPYFWAAPVFVGKTETLKIPGHSYRLLIFLISCILLTAVILYHLRTRNRKPKHRLL